MGEPQTLAGSDLIFEKRDYLNTVQTLSDVLEVYGQLDLSMISSAELCTWQEDCARRLLKMEGGEKFALDFYKMANDTRNADRTQKASLQKSS